MSQTLQERAYHTNSGDVAYWVDVSANTDMPWLIFLPGLTADYTLSNAQMAHFSDKAKYLVWDAPTHGRSRPYPLGFSLDDYARILHGVLEIENIRGPVFVGQLLDGYAARALIDLYPGEAFSFVSIDSALLRRKCCPTWKVKALQHTKNMYRSMSWPQLKSLDSWGVATTAEGKASMRSFMKSYTEKGYAELAVHSYTMLADAVESGRACDIDCPALLLCGRKDRAGDMKVFNRKWSTGKSIPLVWVPGAEHNSNVDNPSSVNSQIEQFMTTL